MDYLGVLGIFNTFIVYNENIEILFYGDITFWRKCNFCCTCSTTQFYNRRPGVLAATLCAC